MIDKASEYTMVDTTGCESFITGDILPHKANAQPNHSHFPIRYEDLLFLYEGKLERNNFKDKTTQKHAALSRSISNRNFFDAVIGVRTDLTYPGWENPLIPFEEDDEWKSIKDNVNVMEIDLYWNFPWTDFWYDWSSYIKEKKQALSLNDNIY